MSPNPCVTTRRVQLGSRAAEPIELPGIHLVALDPPEQGREFLLTHTAIRVGAAPTTTTRTPRIPMGRLRLPDEGRAQDW